MTRPGPEEEPIEVLVAHLCLRFSQLARREVTSLTLKRKDRRARDKRRLLMQIDGALAKLAALYPRRA